ncbi:MAG: Precorrin-3B methylase, partial [Cyanobacteria bacterium P01_H01_bin.153]
CRRIRVARSYWDAHNNRACRGEREKALALYNMLTKAEKERIPQQLRIWLRYRSEKYFGKHRTPPSRQGRSRKGPQPKKRGRSPRR